VIGQCFTSPPTQYRLYGRRNLATERLTWKNLFPELSVLSLRFHLHRLTILSLEWNFMSTNLYGKKYFFRSFLIYGLWDFNYRPLGLCSVSVFFLSRRANKWLKRWLSLSRSLVIVNLLLFNMPGKNSRYPVSYIICRVKLNFHYFDLLYNKSIVNLQQIVIEEFHL